MSLAAPLRRVLRPPVARRRALVMLDQAASSGSNVLVAVLAARSLDSATAFGAFSLAMVAYQLVLGVVRSLVGEPFLSLYSHQPRRVRDAVVADALGTTVFVGLLCSFALWPIATMVGGLSGDALMALGFVLALTLVQDTWRYVFVIDRPGATLLLDAVWLGVVLAVIPLAPDDAGVTWYVSWWGLGGAVGAVLGAIFNVGWAGRPHPWRWVVVHRETSLRFLGEAATAQALGHVLITALGAIAGLAALGAARVTQVFYGPLNMLHAGIYLAVVPEGVALRDQPARLVRKLRLVAVLLVVVVTPWVVVGVLLPDAWGRGLFGDTWNGASKLMLPMGIAAIASAVMSGALLGLRSLADAKRSLQTRLRVVPFLVAFPLLGASLDGAWGFAVGTAVGTSISAVAWWRAFAASAEAVESRLVEQT